jgi:hypothetical protein
MKRKGLIAVELIFFAAAFCAFIPEPKSEPSRYDYSYGTAFVLIAIAISRFAAFRNGRSAVVCVLESLMIVLAYIGARMSFNVIVGQPVL